MMAKSSAKIVKMGEIRGLKALNNVPDCDVLSQFGIGGHDYSFFGIVTWK